MHLVSNCILQSRLGITVKLWVFVNPMDFGQSTHNGVHLPEDLLSSVKGVDGSLGTSGAEGSVDGLGLDGVDGSAGVDGVVGVDGLEGAEGFEGAEGLLLEDRPKRLEL